jgi:glyoxylase-like metal-dependent hydrolase (beta-lactamase superfamily II)
MSAYIQIIKLGGVNCFLVRDKGSILVDTGTPGQHDKILNQVKKLGLDSHEIGLIIITHGHGDHFGSAQRIKELTKAKVAIHREDADIVKKGKKVFPPGLNAWGSFLAFIWRPMFSLINYTGVEPDIILEDEFLLAEFGIKGRIIHTPGHTAGSVSVILDGGEAIVGDLAMNGFPMRRGAGMPIFGNSEREIKQSWKKLLDIGVSIIYPGHGAPFPANHLK